MNAVDANTWYGATLSDAGTCFTVKETTAAGTQFAKDATACSGTQAADAATTYSAAW